MKKRAGNFFIEEQKDGSIVVVPKHRNGNCLIRRALPSYSPFHGIWENISDRQQVCRVWVEEVIVDG